MALSAHPGIVAVVLTLPEEPTSEHVICCRDVNALPPDVDDVRGNVQIAVCLHSSACRHDQPGSYQHAVEQAKLHPKPNPNYDPNSSHNPR